MYFVTAVYKGDLVPLKYPQCNVNENLSDWLGAVQKEYQLQNFGFSGDVVKPAFDVDQWVTFWHIRACIEDEVNRMFLFAYKGLQILGYEYEFLP
jgi:hypothetical protein